MFNWVRPADMPKNEPTEEAIWAMIDGQDTMRNTEVRFRLEQHQEMLVGRDAYYGFFARSSSLPELTTESLDCEEPPEWVSTIKLKCGEYNPLEKSVENVSHGQCDILQPASDTLLPKEESSLLSHRQLYSDSLEWPRNSKVGRISSPPDGYVAWAKYVLRAHKHTLQEAGIYGAVYASLFDYKKLLPSWVRGVAEFWDPKHNACWVGTEKLSITLWELQAISGLSISGDRYEEYIPREEELFGRQLAANGNRRGETTFPSTYFALLNHFYLLHHETNLTHPSTATPADMWIRSFLRGDAITRHSASLKDPFDIGLQLDDELTEDTAEPLLAMGSLSIALPGTDEDLFLAGFLTTWLCVFVLPIQEHTVRPGVMLAASMLARGKRLSLAPAVLAKIYRTFRTISVSNISNMHEMPLPWHYVHAWIHLHVEGAFTSIGYPSYFSEQEYPTVMQLAQASSILEHEKIRLFFFAPYRITDRFRLIHQPDIAGLPADLINANITDGRNSKGKCILLHNGRTRKVAEYFCSMRPGWLCYRFGDQVILEGYQPNHVARQFGYSQATAHDGRPMIPGIANVNNTKKVPLEARLFAAAVVWTHLLRLGTGARFRLAPPNSHTGVSFTCLKRARISFGTAVDAGTRRYERKVRTQAIPRNQRPRHSAPPFNDNEGNGESFPARAESSSHVRQRETRSDHGGRTVPADKRMKHQASTRRSPGPTAQRHPQYDMSWSEPIGAGKEMHSVAPENMEDCYNNMAAEVDAHIYSTQVMNDSPVENRSTASRSRRTPSQQASLSEEGRPIAKSSAGRTSALGAQEDECADVSMKEGESPTSKAQATKSSSSRRASFAARSPEFSGTHVIPNDEAGGAPAYSPIVYDENDTAEPPIIEPQEQVEETSSMPGTEIYSSEIPCRDPANEDPRDKLKREVGIAHLRDVIRGMDPRTPGSIESFIANANAGLNFLATVGIDVQILRYWEEACRNVEYHVKRVMSSSMYPEGVSLTYLQKVIERHKKAVDLARDELTKSDVALEHLEGISANMAAEMESNRLELEDLQCRIARLLSRREELHREVPVQTQSIARARQRREICQQALEDAEMALSQAKEKWQSAENEFRSLTNMVLELSALRDRLTGP